VGAAYFLAFHYYFRFAGTLVGGSSSGSPCTLSDPCCSFDINRSSTLGIVSTGPLARFRGLPLLSRITIGYSPLVFAFVLALLPRRAVAAFLASAVRRSGVSCTMRDLPPFFPPFRSFAAEKFFHLFR
jgi:hypothetical protein